MTSPMSEPAKLDEAAKKTALRMIPYGLYALTAHDGKDGYGAATVNWVTQTAFSPPLIAVGVKADSGAYGILKSTGKFTLNMLGKEHKGVASAFFKPAKVEGGKINGHPFKAGANGAPILEACIGAVECEVKQIVEMGDHHIVVAQVMQAHLPGGAPAGRPDVAILHMRDLGDAVFYGG